jgi:hypothetical protein
MVFGIVNRGIFLWNGTIKGEGSVSDYRLYSPDISQMELARFQEEVTDIP